MSRTFSLLSPHTQNFSILSLPISYLKTPTFNHTLRFYSTRTLNAPKHYQFRTFCKFPKPIFAVDSQLSDADDDDDDDEEAAEEYEDVSGEVSEGIEDDSEEEIEVLLDGDDDAPEAKSKFEEFKWQRVERLRNEVKVFGEEIIDAEELASIYSFRIDKFQVITVDCSYTYNIYIAMPSALIGKPNFSINFNNNFSSWALAAVTLL